MSQDGKLPVSSAPYLKDDYYIKTAMRDVMIALVPVSLVSIYFYRANAVALIAICMATAALTEVVFRKIMGKQPSLYGRKRYFNRPVCCNVTRADNVLVYSYDGNSHRSRHSQGTLWWFRAKPI